MAEINTGNTAWLLISAALVLLMTPGLAFFYGGMVRARSVLNMLMMSFVSMGTVGVLWVLCGYQLSFGPSVAGLIGNPAGGLGLTSLMDPDAVVGDTPALAFVAFQGAFAILAVALISGAVADRMRFAAWVAFTVVWSLLVYFPAAHWVFAADGLAADRGGWLVNDIKAIDFAGGTAIHINAGVAALVLAIVLKPRIGFRQVPMRPHNLTLVMQGAALLWFGWAGFNGGSALTAGHTAALAWVNTIAATAASICGWLITERLRDGHFTSLGAASGVVAGLVGITPGAHAVSPLGALAIGAICGVICSLAIGWKFRLGFDDSLDVAAVHLVGGLVGTLLVGLLATKAAPAGVDGLFYGGGLDQLWRQAVGAIAVMFYSAIVTTVIALVLDRVIGLRITASDETTGIDSAEHAEHGYDLHPAGQFGGDFLTMGADPE